MARKVPFVPALAPRVPLELKVQDSEGVHVLSFQLVLPYSVYPLIEAQAGINMLFPGRVFSLLGDETKPGATVLSVLLWAALQSDQPEYGGAEGLEIVRSYLSLENSAKVAVAIQEAYLRSLPDEQQKALRAAAEIVAKAQAEGGEPPLAPATVQP